MASRQRLTPEERAFFALIGELIFSNPFSTAREQVRAALGEGVSFIGGPFDHALTALDPLLRQRLTALRQRGIERIDQVSGEDRELFRHALLFDIYHAFVNRFDRLIHDQFQRDEHPAPVPFAAELIAALEQAGFNPQDSARYIALFYQFRRAFYFIVRALVGETPSMKQLRHSLWNSVFTRDVRIYGDHLWSRMEDFSTLLLGETGTGKGAAAAAIGRSGLIPFDITSQRFSHSFTTTLIASNLSQFPQTLIESELFGHRKGAFTGAVDHHKGLFERCSPHGSLFLDEIGEVSIPIQIKLLNVLQDRSFTPVGSHQSKRFSGRVIAATNRPVEQLLHEGQFRHDFFYRLSSDIITLPSLRQRIAESPQELERLAMLLLERLSGSAASALADRVLTSLTQQLPPHYPWPGNVRELEQAVRRIILGGSYHSPALASPAPQQWLKQASQGALSADQLLHAYCKMLYDSHGSYEAVARTTGLDRRTAKKYVLMETGQ